MIRFASSISTSRSSEAALDELLAPIDGQVTPGMVDLVMLWSTAHFEDELEDMVSRIGSSFPTAVLMGCTAEGTIGAGQEVEGSPSMSMVAASMPGVELRPFHITQSQLASAESQFAMESLVGVSPESRPSFVAFGDPFQFDTNGFIGRMNDWFPGSALVGGIASAGRSPGENRLIVNGEIVREGMAGVALTGGVRLTTVVSQGCRPIGRSFVITRGERNIIYELGGKPVLEQLHQVMINLPDDDEKLVRESLLIGRVIDEHKSEFSRGDFLIQNIIGVDRRTRAIGITGPARPGTTVQFHVRDASSADEDLRTLLTTCAELDVRGAMVFSCNGRGTRMWPEAGHDIGVLREVLGEIPSAGFFCGGEFGPVGGRNFVHGFTASMALFHE